MKRDSTAMPVQETGVRHRYGRSPLVWLRVLKLFLALLVTLAVPCKVWCGFKSLKVQSCCNSGHAQPNSGHRNRDCCEIDRSIPEIESRIAAPAPPLLAASAVGVIATTLSDGPMDVSERTFLVTLSSVSQRILRI
jgi:hypothetical protein